jgi:hypothetical protein
MPKKSISKKGICFFSGLLKIEMQKWQQFSAPFFACKSVPYCVLWITFAADFSGKRNKKKYLIFFIS